MTADDVIAVLNALLAAGIDASIEGGWGVDALLGRQTREHADLDLAIAREDCAAAAAALAPLGYRHDESAYPGLPARYVLAGGAARQVDLHPLVFDECGNGWQELGDRAWGIHPVELLRRGGTIGGVPVTCIAAELQLRYHLGYPWQPKDEQDLRLLAAELGLPLPPRAAPS